MIGQAHSQNIMADRERYQSRIVSLLHMAQCMRPDLAAPASVLAEYKCMRPDLVALASALAEYKCMRPDLVAPARALTEYSSTTTSTLYHALLDVIRYLASTADRGIRYGIQTRQAIFGVTQTLLHAQT
jgi:hypothetical protein